MGMNLTAAIKWKSHARKGVRLSPLIWSRTESGEIGLISHLRLNLAHKVLQFHWPVLFLPTMFAAPNLTNPATLAARSPGLGSLPSTLIVGTSLLQINDHILSLPSSFFLLATAICRDIRSLHAPLRVSHSTAPCRLENKVCNFFHTLLPWDYLKVVARSGIVHIRFFSWCLPYWGVFNPTVLWLIQPIRHREKVRFNPRPEQYACRQRSRLRPVGREQWLAADK